LGTHEKRFTYNLKGLKKREGKGREGKVCKLFKRKEKRPENSAANNWKMAFVPVVGGLSVLKREQAKSLIENRMQVYCSRP
jgi:hypothetical protein